MRSMRDVLLQDMRDVVSVRHAARVMRGAYARRHASGGACSRLRPSAAMFMRADRAR